METSKDLHLCKVALTFQWRIWHVRRGTNSPATWSIRELSPAKKNTCNLALSKPKNIHPSLPSPKPNFLPNAGCCVKTLLPWFQHRYCTSQNVHDSNNQNHSWHGPKSKSPNANGAMSTTRDFHGFPQISPTFAQPACQVTTFFGAATALWPLPQPQSAASHPICHPLRGTAFATRTAGETALSDTRGGAKRGAAAVGKT